MNASRLHFLAVSSLLCAGFMGSATAAVVNGLVYIPISPCRIVDTRLAGGPFAPQETRVYDPNGSALQAGSNCTVYSGEVPTALSVNVTVDSSALGNPIESGYLKLFDQFTTSASWMNFVGGQTIANAGVATLEPDGTFNIKTQNATNLIVDVFGYFIQSPIARDPSLDSITIGTGATASGFRSTAIGHSSVATGSGSTAIGLSTAAIGSGSVAMNAGTFAIGDYSIATGQNTVASGNWATAMGSFTTASGPTSTAMGNTTLASGDASIAIGSYSSATGNGSVAIGTHADTNNFAHSFAFSDGTGATNDAQDQFMVRFSGGFKFYTSNGTTGVSLAPGSGAWTVLSDRNAKDYVQTVDARAVLDRVVELPLNTWHYKTQDAKYRHMGPMAQDFYAAFHLGESDTGIDTVDADGVALAAIQGLNAKVNEQDKEIASLRADLAAMKHQLVVLSHSQTNDVVVADAPH